MNINSYKGCKQTQLGYVQFHLYLKTASQVPEWVANYNRAPKGWYRLNLAGWSKILNAFSMYVCSSGCFRGIYILTCQVFSESHSFTNQTPTILSCLWSSGTPYLSAWKLQSPSKPHCDIKRAIIYNNTKNKKVLRKRRKEEKTIQFQRHQLLFSVLSFVHETVPYVTVNVVQSDIVYWCTAAVPSETKLASEVAPRQFASINQNSTTFLSPAWLLISCTPKSKAVLTFYSGY